MSDQQPKVREVAWSELFPWLILLRTVRMALMARVLLLGALGLIVTGLGWWLIDMAFQWSDDPVILDWRGTDGGAERYWIWTSSPEFEVATSARSASELFLSATSGLVEAPVAIWLHLTRPFVDLFAADLTITGFIFLLLCGIWELAVWGVAGGAITRIAALKFTRDEAPGFVAAVLGAAGKLPSYSIGPLIALGGAAVFAIQLMVLGWLMRLSFVAMLAGLAWPFVLLLGLLMAILLIGALVGWPLMWATVSVEGTDAFDALSRSYAYVYQRPLRLLWYVLFAAVLAAVSMFVVKLFAAAAISLGDWSIAWGLDEARMRDVVKGTPVAEDSLAPPIFPETPVDIAVTDAEPTRPGWMTRAATNTIWFWKTMMAALAAGYQAGFLWVAGVGIYLLLRRDIDGAEMDEVYVEPEDEHGLPPLADEAGTGVPEVSPGGDVQPGDRGAPDEGR